jgi:outer membrane protein
MKFQILLPSVGFAAAMLMAGSAAQAAGSAAPPANARHAVLVIDRQEIVKDSKLGQDIHKQIMDYVSKAQAEFGSQGRQIQNDTQALQVQPQSADRDKKMQALQLKEAEFRQKVQVRQNLIQGGEMAAQQRFSTELSAVATAILQERGADVVVEKAAIFASAGGLDITQAVIQRLDQKITTFKVPLVAAPANSIPQAQ